MRKVISLSTKQAGFTAVELLITIIVAAIFTVSIYGLFTTINRASADARQQATASDLAYANLRRYASADITPDSWSPAFVCSTATGASNTNDVTVNQNATGTTLTSGSLNPVTAELPGPVTYSVKALAIFGCRNANEGKPIRVESTITYGPQQKVIKHATLVGY